MIQKRIAAQIFGCGVNKVRFDETKLAEIKEAITKYDIRKLIAKQYITRAVDNTYSRVRARFRLAQKRKGRRKGYGTRKGNKDNSKTKWINHVRAQRELIQELKPKLPLPEYHDLYAKVKGGFFRSRNHIMAYVKERGFAK